MLLVLLEGLAGCCITFSLDIQFQALLQWALQLLCYHVSCLTAPFLRMRSQNRVH